MKDSLLLMDFSGIFYKSMKLSNLSLTWRGKPTTGIYGFISQFCEQVNAIKPEYVIVCTDCKPYDRNKIYPEYKANRKTTDSESVRYEDIKWNRERTEDFLDLLGIEYWKEKGLEADDLISLACKRFHNKFRRIVVSSGDSDLIQLLKHQSVCLRKKKKDRYILYSIDNFKKEFQNISMKQYIRYLCITGTHNAVPGIPGLGPVTAIEIVKSEFLWDELYDMFGKELDLYAKLIELPFRNNTQRIPELKKAKYNERKMITFMISLGIDLTQSMRKAFNYINERDKGE